MKLIDLTELSGAALIVPEKTGVFFTNQVNGHICEQPQLEGFLIPINNDRFADDPEFLESLLFNIFDDYYGKFTEDKANEIDEILSRFPETKGINVNRDRIDESVESWVHVVAQETDFSCYKGFGEIRGILTWQNSD